MTWAVELDLLLKVSIIVLIAHALSWVGLEWLFDWHYATGRTPKGLHAVVMSLSLTLPALAAPLFFRALAPVPLVNHLHGAFLSVAGGAIAYIILFGMDDRVFPGIREYLLRRFHQHPWWAEVLATFAYALILIVLIATPYRLIAQPRIPAYIDLGQAALVSLLTFFGLSAYILLKYPESLETKSHWGFLRGIIAGIFTVISVCTALYA
jgi:hypothetical protein